MSGLAANAMMFNPGAVAFSRDLKAAYLLSGLGSCHPGLHGEGTNSSRTETTQPSRFKTAREKRFWIGCTPDDCRGGCDKDMFGIRWLGQLYRFAAPCFGSKHGGNVLETLLAPVIRKIKALGCNVCSWVDDFCCVVENRGGATHDPMTCGGEKGCEHCAETFERARRIEKMVDHELEQLGFSRATRRPPLHRRGSSSDWRMTRFAERSSCCQRKRRPWPKRRQNWRPVTTSRQGKRHSSGANCNGIQSASKGCGC